MTNNNEDNIFEALLEFLRQERGFDFTGYKRSSLMRRVSKRMQTFEIDNFEAYLDYLQVHPEEFLPLFNTILINVTAFFRDKSAWNYLQRHAINRILQEKPITTQVRVWSAGCSSGEEAYTLAMILAEAIGVENFRQRIKIYATDIDEEALTQARHASYTDKDLKPVPDELRQKYFEPTGGRYVFRPDLRRGIIFGRHDLVQDAPISRLDLLVCRNTLMYFNAETQGKILNRFHFALNNTGVLFLGKAEMMLTHTNIFTPLSLQHRIFRRVPSKNRRDRLLYVTQTETNNHTNNLERQQRIQDLAFDGGSVAQIIIDFNGILVLANTPARGMFSLNLLDIGRPLQDLEISYRPLELRSHIEQIYSDRRLLIVRDVVRHLPEGNTQYLDIHFNPLEEGNSEILGVSISFVDVTRYHELQQELQRSNQELETANEELQSSNEELETTNEELQSTNEELETTNEELQSTNEELETMNEELQSTNEELQTINEELRQRTAELDQTNAFLNSILASLQAGVVVVNTQFNILTWNDEAENMWGLRFDEVKGQSLLSLDIGLSVEQLREPIRNCLANTGNRQGMLVEAINRRGRSIECRLSFNPLIGHKKERQGVIILMEEMGE
ncbi:MAG: CheR family methyltransferase [Xenococcaceae cyanobacterium MO_167.B27]|nr:CheR family methyltransferase [Xenococcaceae cyanobacterium MO_167.B27]